jgi:mono/diheme cytochrome c family protein
MGCTSCHLPLDAAVPAIFADRGAFLASPPEGSACAACHRNNAAGVRASPRPTWLPLSEAAQARVAKDHPYLGAPDLAAPLGFGEAAAGTGTTRWSLQRFTACGLRRFLSSPVPRHARAGGAEESMFPLSAPQIDAIVEGSGLEECAGAANAGEAARARGEAQFGALGCAGCHAAKSARAPAAPRLRLGFPLLARAYFAARVREGSGRGLLPVHAFVWSAAGTRLVPLPRAQATASLAEGTTADAAEMPAYQGIAEDDVAALYAYVASDASDLPHGGARALRDGGAERGEARAPRDPWSKEVGARVFRQVRERVFDGACKHCHDASPGATRAVAKALGRAPEVEFPTSRRATVPSPTLARALSPGPECAPSPIVVRLRRRQAEWTGREGDGNPGAGMPLTRAPLDDGTIRLIDAWTMHGCPSDAGDLCVACRPGG